MDSNLAVQRTQRCKIVLFMIRPALEIAMGIPCIAWLGLVVSTQGISIAYDYRFEERLSLDMVFPGGVVRCLR